MYRVEFILTDEARRRVIMHFNMAGSIVALPAQPPRPEVIDNHFSSSLYDYFIYIHVCIVFLCE